MCSNYTYFSFGKILNWEVLERSLKFIAIGLIIIIFILITVLVSISNEKNKCDTKLEEENKQICLTPACIETAAYILNNMDPTIDPCKNFYQFACGNFMKNTDIPDDQPAVNSFVDVQNNVYRQLRTIIEESTKPEELKSFVLKKFYNTCMNTTAIEEHGLITIKAIVDSFGGWPVLQEEKWHGAAYHWEEIMYQLKFIGYTNCILKVDVIIDPKNSSSRVISLDQPDLGLNREFLVKGLENNVVQWYLNYMVEVAVLLGANRSMAAIELTRSLELEIALAQISLSARQRQNQNALYHPTTIADLQKEYPYTNWKMYIKYHLNVQNLRIKDNEVIILRAPNYLSDLEDLLKNTDKRIQANYIMWRVVSSSIPYLSDDLRSQRQKFFAHLYGEERMWPRWKECTYETLHNFWDPLTILYKRKHLNKDTEANIMEMLTNIQKEFINMLHHLDWMDQKTKITALRKAASMPISLGFVDEVNDENLTKRYGLLNFSPDNYLMAALTMSLFRQDNNFEKLRKPVSKKERSEDVSLAYQIDVPLGIFQGIFFNNDRPHYMNYGAVGTIIAHLITHVFDNHGKQFDENDNFVEWWTEGTRKAFNEKSQCMVEQYYEKHTINMDRSKTQDEDIADNAGLKAAYLAYNKFVIQTDSEQLIPGLNYTQKQMFWLSNANMWCEKLHKEELANILQTSTFSLSYYRVIQLLKNSEYFAKDFNCSLGSQMNPETKCPIW